ncbi:hypothetical protein [Janibacter sp. DB-40]|uniref:hypothetical protein n=1 Tax=Janibacter sp. DB-40 TaxID=3028808 RepID=UPI00240723BD|nr:hypothetical protein [Janibacter sp. DB-40]
MSSALLLTALVAIGVGSYAWQLDRNPPTRVSGSSAIGLGQTPLFDPGVTLFVHEGDLEDDFRASRWSCALSTADGRRDLRTPGDVERTGTRVQDGQALVPALVIGETSRSDRLSCPDLPADVVAWSLPTEAGYPRIPMALVVGGVALAGVSALSHPRSRGLARFV